VKRREVSGRTQAEVRVKLREIRDGVEAGGPVKDAATTVGAWLDDWTTRALPASDRKQATIDLYTTIACRHLAPKLGNVPLDRLRPSDVEALVLAKRRARAGDPLVTLRCNRVAVPFAVRLLYSCRGGPDLSADPPLTCGFTVGLTGFEPATP
jgi:hypothetical protein